MKYFSLMDGMDIDMAAKFMEFANANTQEAWTIVMNTQGGSFFVAELMAHVINSHKLEVEIIVQAAYSAGFILVMETKCNKILSKGCRGMLHYGRWELQFNDTNKPYGGEDACIVKNMPIHRRQSEAIAKKVMTAKEFKDFKLERDVYFDTKRMKEIFPDAILIK